MNPRSIRVIALGLLVIAGLALGLIGVLLFSGDTRDALLYPGSGTAALTFVLLVQTLRPRHELKKVALPGEENEILSLH